MILLLATTFFEHFVYVKYKLIKAFLKYIQIILDYLLCVFFSVPDYFFSIMFPCSLIELNSFINIFKKVSLWAAINNSHGGLVTLMFNFFGAVTNSSWFCEFCAHMRYRGPRELVDYSLIDILLYASN